MSRLHFTKFDRFTENDYHVLIQYIMNFHTTFNHDSPIYAIALSYTYVRALIKILYDRERMEQYLKLFTCLELDIVGSAIESNLTFYNNAISSKYIHINPNICPRKID
jgi:hypothetical protein